MISNRTFIGNSAISKGAIRIKKIESQIAITNAIKKWCLFDDFNKDVIVYEFSYW
jgi:hypothetical protein